MSQAWSLPSGYTGSGEGRQENRHRKCVVRKTESEEGEAEAETGCLRARVDALT